MASKTPSFSFPVYIINMKQNPDRYENVVKQLNKLRITNYQRWEACDGKNTSGERMIKAGMAPAHATSGGIGGCATSHLELWRHIAENKMGWTLVLEDDVDFHPQFNILFNAYRKYVPHDAKILYLGGDPFPQSNQPIIAGNPLCTHAYMISWKGAEYLLKNLLPIDGPIDLVLSRYFKTHSGSYVINSGIQINGIDSNKYRTSNSLLIGYGIIYQNRKYPTTINS